MLIYIVLMCCGILLIGALIYLISKKLTSSINFQLWQEYKDFKQLLQLRSKIIDNIQLVNLMNDLDHNVVLKRIKKEQEKWLITNGTKGCVMFSTNPQQNINDNNTIQKYNNIYNLDRYDQSTIADFIQKIKKQIDDKEFLFNECFINKFETLKQIDEMLAILYSKFVKEYKNAN